MTGPSDESTLPDPGSDPRRNAAGVTAGTVLRDRYVLEEHVATGASAAVWRAFDTQLRRTVAVKVLDDDVDDEAVTDRFRAEAVTAARLTHPGIVSVYDTGDHDGRTWLALEHVDGPDLLTVLRHHLSGLPDTVAAAIVEQAAAALALAHAHGVVHRDVKPANLLLTVDGVVKVSDFGIAGRVGDHVPPTGDEPVGTAAYAPPEQLRGDVDIDPRMDVFALGVVLFEALTGQAAFPSTGPGQDRDQPLRPRLARADVDRALDALVARATDPDPTRRHRDAGELAAELRALVPVEPQGPTADAVATVHRVTAGPGGALPPTTGPGGRWRWVALAVAVLAAVAGAAAVLVSAGGGGSDDATVRADAGIPVSDVRLYDPYGSVETDPGPLLVVVDGDPTTAWSTPLYPRPLRALGLPGVGVRIDVGQPVAVDELRLMLGPGAVTVELLARDERPPPGSTELDWAVVARAEDAGGEVVLDTSARTARHWLVWFTALEDTGDGWQASLVDVSFEPVDGP